MNKKYIFISLFLIMALFVSGCVGGVGEVYHQPLVNEEQKIRSFVYEFGLAINDQNWNKVKSHCLYGSEAYYQACMVEDMYTALRRDCPDLAIVCAKIITSVYIYGNFSEAHGIGSTSVSACGTLNSTGNIALVHYLQRVGNTWKIYK